MKVKEVTTKTYVAEDGKEFLTKNDCETYEKTMVEKQRKEYLLSEVSKFFIDEAEGFPPFNGGENYAYHGWYWCKIFNQFQLDIVNELYQLNVKIDNFPELICIEEDVCGTAYYEEPFSDSIRYVKELCAKLGVEVEFKQQEKKSVMEKYNYIFVLGYDLLQNFLSEKACECDAAFEFCKIVYHHFLESEFNDEKQAEYDCLQNYIASLSYDDLEKLYWTDDWATL